MHVEVSVAVNFFISYLYNKLPRRRVDLFGEELEKGLKQKFEGHWYPDKPFKGSGFRCIRCNGEKVDVVISQAAKFMGLDLNEIKEYVPEELTMWIDPSEVSYRLNEKSPVKILYTDRHDEDGCGSADREVQIHTFNPEALSFQPIDSLSSSLSSLSLSPSSPAPPPGAWSTSVSPSAALFSSPISSAGAAHHASFAGSPVSAASLASAASAAGSGAAPVLMGRANINPQFTAATFAQTKFGSTKLKTQAKRPTRLSPTEMGNYFRQQQQRAAGFVAPAISPQRPRSLSPRDPRLEFFMDQQQRFYQRGQLSPQNQQSLAQTLQQTQQQQQLQQQQQQQQQLQQQHQQQQQYGLHQYHHQQPQQKATFPPCSSAQGPVSPGNGYAANPPSHFGHSYAKSRPGGGPMPWSLGGNDPWSAPRSSASPHLSPSSAYPDFFPSATPPFSSHSATSAAGLLSPPEGHKSFLEELQQLSNVHHGYPSGLQHLLVAN